MKFLKFLLPVVIFFSSLTWGADTVNGDSASYVEDEYGYTWYGKVTFAAGNKENDIWSHAFDASDIDLLDNRATIQVWGNAVSNIDVNVFVEGSNTLWDTAFVAFRTDVGLDAAGAKSGKLAIIGGADIFAADTVVSGGKNTQEFLAHDAASHCQYLRLQFDGQTNNPAGAIIYFSVRLPKRIVGRTSRATNKLSATTATLPTYGAKSILIRGHKVP